MNAKRKGNAGEHKFAHWLMANGIKAFRNSMSGGSIWKGDIANDLDMTIEIKTVKKLNLQECWRQVEADAGKARNTPVLAVKFDKMPSESWLVCMESSDWLALVKGQK